VRLATRSVPYSHSDQTICTLHGGSHGRTDTTRYQALTQDITRPQLLPAGAVVDPLVGRGSLALAVMTRMAEAFAGAKTPSASNAEVFYRSYVRKGCKKA
jgi:hypothetical protein